MKWRQFFTPVKSMDSAQAREMIENTPREDISIIDVRQPGEYKSGHIPGARLIPVGELGNRLNEIPADKPAVVYCAVGGRSRVAAQMMAAKGFSDVINLAGGFKAWKGNAAVGPVDQGLDFFSGQETIDQILAVAYSIEDGLRDFYLIMAEKVRNAEAADLFAKLAEIEVKHQDRVYGIYKALADQPMPREAFVTDRVGNVIEGGLTTEAYIAMFKPDMESVVDIISLAMSIEAQALDLYSRAAEAVTPPEGQKALAQLADEERTHIRRLGELIDGLSE